MDKKGMTISKGKGFMDPKEIKKIDTKIKAIRKAAEALRYVYGNIPAIDRNAVRILASVKMLEINVSDLLT